MTIQRIISMFKKRNVCVFGLRGDGKDMLMSNVIVRRREPYVSNFVYDKSGKYHQDLEFSKIDCGQNSWIDLINNDIKYYEFPYKMGSDIYISDAGVYLPAQYCNEINRKYPFLATYFALSRQVSRNNVHINVQALNRLYDKVREQSDIYIRCRFCHVLFGRLVLKYKERFPILDKIPLLVIQKITLYDKYQSAVDRVEPCRISVPFMAKREVKQQAAMYVDKFHNTYGKVYNSWLLYFNLSHYDTHHFQKLFLKGRKENEE